MVVRTLKVDRRDEWVYLRASMFRLLACLALIGCAAEGPAETDDIVVEGDDKSDSATELRVRVADTTLWMDKALVRRGDDLVLSGRTSRNITDGRAFIFDDIYGDFAQRSARTFEVTWPVSTARGVVDGVNLFTGLSFGSRHLTARVVVRPRLVAISGSLSLTSEITPVIVAGRIVYRVKGKATQAVTSNLGVARATDSTHFEIDLGFDDVASTSQLVVTAGTQSAKASFGMFVKYFGATTGDVETVFPSPACTADRLACLSALPDGTLDTGSCAPALLVQACRGQIGVVVDQAAIAQTLATVDARLAGTFATDATALVGVARAPALRTALRAQLASGLDDTLGLWLLSNAAKTKLLDIEPAFDRAYANPLALVPAAPLAPGNLAGTRQVVADALLAYLQTTDYEHSEFDRSYLELTRVFRAQHLASLRAFRETVTPETIGGTVYYIDRWLGAHTEITVDASGAATNVYVELD